MVTRKLGFSVEKSSLKTTKKFKTISFEYSKTSTTLKRYNMKRQYLKKQVEKLQENIKKY